MSKQTVQIWLLSVAIALLACPIAFGTDLSGTARIDTLIWRCTVQGNNATVTEHRRTTVLNAAGKKFGNVYVWENSFYKTSSAEMRFYDSAGRLVKKVGKSDMTKYCGYDQSFELYNDNCTYFFEPTSPTYPYTIVWDYECQLNSLFFVRGPNLESHIPTTFGLVELSYDTANPIHYRVYGADLPVKERTEKARRIVSWTIQNLDALPDLNDAPADYEEGYHIRFAAERFQFAGYSANSLSWKNLGLFDKSLCDSRYLPMPAIVTPPASDQEAIATANRLYEEITRKTRYVAVEMGLSGWQPEMAEKTQRTGYGDCKGLSTLLISRLRAAGIRAYPALVRTNNLRPVDSDFVGDNFNHFITLALVGSDTVWFDPTSHYCPAGNIPSGDENILVLAVTDTGGVLVRTPQAPAEDNRIDRVTRIAIDNSGSVTAEATVSFAGHSGEWVRHSLDGETREDATKFIHDYFADRATQLTADSCKSANLDSLKLPAQLFSHLTGKQPILQINHVRYLVPFLLNSRDLLEDVDLKTRTIGISLLYYPVLRTDSVIIQSPWITSADSVKLPASDSIGYPDGYLRYRFRRDGDRLVGEVTELWPSYIPPESFPKLEIFLAARKKLFDQPVKFYVKTL